MLLMLTGIAGRASLTTGSDDVTDATDADAESVTSAVGGDTADVLRSLPLPLTHL